jgi:hypothetical protein
MLATNQGDNKRGGLKGYTRREDVCGNDAIVLCGGDVAQ